jgi:tRNA A37 threonylcarbamoyltransferase TsaD
MYKLVESNRARQQEGKSLTKQEISDLCATFQNVAFKHVERVLNYYLSSHRPIADSCLLFGGGVSANTELRKRLRKICKEFGMNLLIPYSKKLCTDNAAMIGIVAGFKFQSGETIALDKLDTIERLPRWKVDE